MNPGTKKKDGVKNFEISTLSGCGKITNGINFFTKNTRELKKGREKRVSWADYLSHY